MCIRDRQKIERLDQVSTLPLDYRARLAEQGWGMGFPAIARKFVSSDGTVRYLVELADGERVDVYKRQVFMVPNFTWNGATIGPTPMTSLTRTLAHATSRP